MIAIGRDNGPNDEPSDSIRSASLLRIAALRIGAPSFSKGNRIPDEPFWECTGTPPAAKRASHQPYILFAALGRPRQGDRSSSLKERVFELNGWLPRFEFERYLTAQHLDAIASHLGNLRALACQNYFF